MALRIAERRHTDVGIAQWRRLADDSGFWHLVERGIVSVSNPRRGVFRIRGGAYVGRASLASEPIELVEKIPGALAALLTFATRERFIVQRIPAPATDLGSLIALLVHQFLAAVGRYVSAGREAEYIRVRAQGSLVGGKIDMTRSLALRARGLGHLLVFERNVLSRRTPVNRVLLRAIREVASLDRILPIGEEDRATARGLGEIFMDAADQEVLFGPRSAALELAQTLVTSNASTEREDLLMLATVVLAHQSFEPSDPSSSNVPRAWFLDLETLFESAVRQVLRRLAPNLDIGTGSSMRRHIFAGRNDYPAKPDLVVTGGHVAVGDVKYKDWNEAGSEQDIYQLLAHASAFGAQESFLVYPDDRFSSIDLGPTKAGCRVQLFGVDILDLDHSLTQVLRRVGFRVDAVAAA